MSTAPQTGTIEPFRFEDGALLILDQRALPAEERWIRCETVEQVAQFIRTLAVRGAPAIGIAAAYAMALAEDRDAAAELLRSTRPTAVNLAWALERTRDADDPLEAARRLHQDQRDADRRLAELGVELFADGTRALTHCNTGALATGGIGTACGVLRVAWERGRLAEVWVDETRPLLQGARLTAWELRQAGIPHRVVADSAAGSLMAQGRVDRVIVGADRIAANGDVANKVGTYPLAVLADRHAVPFYVAAPVSTIDPATPDGASIPIEERDPAEVVAAGDAFNPAFDVTPAELVTAIVTEAGVLEPPYGESIAKALASDSRTARDSLARFRPAEAERPAADADALLSSARRPLVSASAAAETSWAPSRPPSCAAPTARARSWVASPGSGGRSTRIRDRAPRPRSRERGGSPPACWRQAAPRAYATAASCSRSRGWRSCSARRPSSSMPPSARPRSRTAWAPRRQSSAPT